MTTYPALPSKVAWFDIPSGVFDASAGLPALRNSVGSVGQRYIVSHAGYYNFATGAVDLDYGTALAAGDELIYLAGIWQTISRGASGSYLLRSGALSMQGPLDTDGNPVLLRDGLLTGTSDSMRALARYLEISGGSWSARTNLLRVRGKEIGNADPPSLVRYELGADLLTALPRLLIGTDGAGSTAVLVGPTRQVELDGTQTIVGAKTFRTLKFGGVGSEAEFPNGRGDLGTALIQGPDGKLVWGTIELSAIGSSIVLTAAAATIQASFNASGPFTIARDELAFVTWAGSLYIWCGGGGSFGLGQTQATADDFSGPILSTAGTVFATSDDIVAGTDEAKAVSAATAADALMVVAQGAPSQVVWPDVTTKGNWTAEGTLNIASAGTLAAAGRVTIDKAPRTGTDGTKDAVNRAALDGRFAASLSPTADDAGKAPILNSEGKLPGGLVSNLWKGLFDPTAPGAPALRNVAAGGISAGGGEMYAVSTTGRWNFTTGAYDPSGTSLPTGALLIWDAATVAWQILAGSSGGSSLPLDGSAAMTGNLQMGANTVTFTAGGGISGDPANPVSIRNSVMSAGSF